MCLSLSFHLLHHLTYLSSVTLLSITGDQPLTLFLPSHFSYMHTYLTAAITEVSANLNAVKSAVIWMERQKKRGTEWGMGGEEQI